MSPASPSASWTTPAPWPPSWAPATWWWPPTRASVPATCATAPTAASLQGRAVRGARPAGRRRGLALAVGTNTDDLGDHRLLRAAADHGVLTPLVAAGLSKAEVLRPPAAGAAHGRQAGRGLPGLPIAYGVQVTPARLSRVERAEALLRSFGLAQLRVRDHGDLARIEVPVGALGELVEPGRRARLVAGLHDLGFTYVTLDLEGFRSGSMNAALKSGRPAR